MSGGDGNALRHATFIPAKGEPVTGARAASRWRVWLDDKWMEDRGTIEDARFAVEVLSAELNWIDPENPMLKVAKRLQYGQLDRGSLPSFIDRRREAMRRHGNRFVNRATSPSNGVENTDPRRENTAAADHPAGAQGSDREVRAPHHLTAASALRTRGFGRGSLRSGAIERALRHAVLRVRSYFPPPVGSVCCPTVADGEGASSAASSPEGGAL